VFGCASAVDSSVSCLGLLARDGDHADEVVDVRSHENGREHPPLEAIDIAPTQAQHWLEPGIDRAAA